MKSLQKLLYLFLIFFSGFIRTIFSNLCLWGKRALDYKIGYKLCSPNSTVLEVGIERLRLYSRQVHRNNTMVLNMCSIDCGFSLLIVLTISK